MTAQWIWPIEDDELLAVFAARFHRQRHRADVSVAAATDVLEIEEHDVDVGQHGRGRFASAPVKGESGELRQRVPTRPDLLPCRLRAVESVFRHVECGEADLGRTMQDKACSIAAPVEARLIADESHAFAGYRPEPESRRTSIPSFTGKAPRPDDGATDRLLLDPSPPVDRQLLRLTERAAEVSKMINRPKKSLMFECMSS